MNAHNFVAEHGIEAVKHAIEEANAYGGDWIDTKTLEIKKHIPSSDSVFIGELKQVVESVEIVEGQGGYDELKQKINEGDVDWKNIPKFRKVIEDYEHVQAYKNGEA